MNNQIETENKIVTKDIRKVFLRNWMASQTGWNYEKMGALVILVQ